jgi:hypothetical protein
MWPNDTPFVRAPSTDDPRSLIEMRMNDLVEQAGWTRPSASLFDCDSYGRGLTLRLPRLCRRQRGSGRPAALSLLESRDAGRSRRSRGAEPPMPFPFLAVRGNAGTQPVDSPSPDGGRSGKLGGRLKLSRSPAQAKRCGGSTPVAATRPDRFGTEGAAQRAFDRGRPIRDRTCFWLCLPHQRSIGCSDRLALPLTGPLVTEVGRGGLALAPGSGQRAAG